MNFPSQHLWTTCIGFMNYLYSFFMLTKTFLERQDHGYAHEHVYIGFMQLA